MSYLELHLPDDWPYKSNQSNKNANMENRMIRTERLQIEWVNKTNTITYVAMYMFFFSGHPFAIGQVRKQTSLRVMELCFIVAGYDNRILKSQQNFSLPSFCTKEN